MFYDLHIHSALSPCSDDTMTINNIVNMSYINQLDLISITDHNSTKNLTYLQDVCNSEIVKGKIDYIYGVEFETKEKIHVLGYFKKDAKLNEIQRYLDTHLNKKLNNESYYGNQFILNANDEVIGVEKYLLIESLDVSIYGLVKQIHAWNGIVVLAHVKDRKNGCYSYFNEIPKDLHFDAIEITNTRHKEELIKERTDLLDTLFLMNSDAHSLENINDASYDLDIQSFMKLWG